jgi:hypothetical protein
MRNTVIHYLLAVTLSISAFAQMASGVSSMASPKLRQFLTAHREASQIMSNALSEAFSNRTVRLHYFYSEDESVARARHWYPDKSSVIILVRENQQPCDEFIMLIFEMLNSESEKQFMNLFDEAKAGTVTKEDFIRGILQQEFEAYKRTQSLVKNLKLSEGEITESYYYNRFVHLPSDFEGFLAYQKQVSPKRDPAKEYGPQYDHLRNIESRPNTALESTATAPSVSTNK